MKANEEDFNHWWSENKDGYPATPLMRRCFYAGFEYAIDRVVRWIVTLVVGLTLMLVFASLAACQERYRYPCQDPKNWEREECKRPLCTATQTCPEQLYKPEELKGEIR
jgi:hypothetical protein